MGRVHVPVAITRIDRWVLGGAVVAAAGASLVVWLSQDLVAPPRPRVSASERPMIGVALKAEPGGILVRRAAGPARDAGLRAGDRIVAFAGIERPTIPALVDRIQASRDGDMLRVEARRAAPGAGETAVLAEVKVATRKVSPADEGLAYEDVAFRNGEGLILRGWYVPSPVGGAGRSPAIAWAHGNAADRRQWMGVAVAVHDAGVAQLLFDFTGRGDSDGDVITLGAHEASDMRSALDALAARADVDPLRLAVGGKSMGGSAAILEAGDDARVKALVLDSPFADLVGVIDHAIASYHLPPALIRPLLLRVAGWRASYDPYAVRPVDAIARIRAPILLFHGEADQTVPFGDALRLSAAAKSSVTLVKLNGLDHNAPRPDDYADRIADFLKRSLVR